MQEQKTDLMKYKELLDSFGLFYIQEQTQGTPNTTLVYLAETYDYPITEKKVKTPKITRYTLILIFIATLHSMTKVILNKSVFTNKG